MREICHYRYLQYFDTEKEKYVYIQTSEGIQV